MLLWERSSGLSLLAGSLWEALAYPSAALTHDQRSRVLPDPRSRFLFSTPESLLLALTDLKVISEQDACDLLTDVATTHSEAPTTAAPEKHQAVVEIVQRILEARTACGAGDA